MVKKTKGKNATSKKIKNADKIKLPSSKVEIELTAGSVEPAMKAAEAKSSKLFKVPVASIKTIPGFNVRVDSADYQAHKAALVQSITENGYDQTKPLAGYVAKEDGGNVIYVTDGHTRLAAVEAINADGGEIATLPVLVHPADKSITDLTVALHTANNGRPLTPFELGVVVKRLLREEDADKKAIAKRLAVTPRYLDDVLLLVNGPKEVRDLVLAGTISSTLAIQTLRDDPESAAEKLTSAAEEAGTTEDGKAKKVTAKNVAKTKKLKHEVAVTKGDDLKAINKAVRQAIAAALPHTEGEGEDATTADVKATITVIVEVPAPKKAAKKPAKKPVAKKSEKAEKTEDKAPAKKGGKKPASKPKAKPTAEESDDDELGIDGAEAVDDSDLDSEEAAVPPKVPTVDEDDDVDI